jgi:hypothetical protein
MQSNFIVVTILCFMLTSCKPSISESSEEQKQDSISIARLQRAVDSVNRQGIGRSETIDKIMDNVNGTMTDPRTLVPAIKTKLDHTETTEEAATTPSIK